MDPKELWLLVSINFCNVTSPINRWSLFPHLDYSWLCRWIQHMSKCRWGQKRNHLRTMETNKNFFKPFSLGVVCYPEKSNWNTLLWRLSVISNDKKELLLIFSFTSIFIAVARTTLTIASKALSILLGFFFKILLLLAEWDLGRQRRISCHCTNAFLFFSRVLF